ncbi:hypothetical protein NBO_300g0002 [Nosema bombycis CQ1]|uniref:Uncharacterized protein n=1 Tax=Nosema bombycis (strain CQ1 / CVCC 102059) TaxID=578461 RepID=R0MFQ4_NOSB1|nr:hypothetical protein NBO_300g0002 [Nosema bombycis CQ1]|eukprot:EOB12950.1 hypothetical protein NBO_300g0002 [Nosema bombycis CQ1]
MDSECYHIGDLCMPNTSHYDYTNGKFLSVIGPDLTENILSKLDNKEQAFLKFHYTFIDCQNSMNAQKRECHYDNYKILSKGTGDTINIEGKGPSIYLYHIKLILQKIFIFKFVKIEDYEVVLNGIFTAKSPKFKLQYFKSLPLCYKNFKTFVKFLNLIKCDKYDRNNVKISDNHLKISHLKKYLQEKFDEYKKMNNYNQHLMIEFIFKEFCIEIIKQLTSNNIPLPIKANLTIEYYFDQFFSLIKKTIESLIKDLDSVSCCRVQDVFGKYLSDFKQDIQQIDKLIFDDIWKSIDVLEYFSVLLGKDVFNIEDYIEAERVICDFHNMMRCCFEMQFYSNNSCTLSLVEPMLNDDFDCRIIRALEIT